MAGGVLSVREGGDEAYSVVGLDSEGKGVG